MLFLMGFLCYFKIQNVLKFSIFMAPLRAPSSALLFDFFYLKLGNCWGPSEELITPSFGRRRNTEGDMAEEGKEKDEGELSVGRVVGGRMEDDLLLAVEDFVGLKELEQEDKRVLVEESSSLGLQWQIRRLEFRKGIQNHNSIGIRIPIISTEF